MKKLNTIFVLFAVALSVSCKKDAVQSQITNMPVDQVKLQALITKYHLHAGKEDRNSTNSVTMKNFNTLEEMDAYLKSIDHKRVVTGVGIITDKADNSSSGLKTSATYSSFGSQHNASIHFSGFSSVSYPQTLDLTWTTNGSASSFLVYSGSSSGTWTYNQSYGYDSNSVVIVHGTYSETISFLGLHTWTYDYYYDYNSGTWGNGHIYGTASFTPYSSSSSE